MTIRRLLLIFVLVGLLLLLKPKAVWAEFQRVRGQWNTILGLLVIVVLGYLLYGIWMLISGELPW